MEEAACVAIIGPMVGYLPLQLVLGFHIVICLLATVLSIYTIGRYFKVYFHSNCKVLVGFGVYVFVMWDEHWGPENLVPTCSIGNKYTGENAARCMALLLGLDFLGFISMSHSYWREFRKDTKSYDIRKRFTVMERRETNTILLPFTAMHTIFYLIYEIVYLLCTQVLVNILPPLVFKAVFVSINFIPYYTVLSNIFLIALLNRVYRTRQTKWRSNFRLFTDKRQIHTSYMNGW
ncbi:unnamed protein product, partial [Mesorhabditis spiculigera]